MTVFLIIVAALLGGLFGYGMGVSGIECPRIIRGYPCQGDECNHCKAEVRQAHIDTGHIPDETNFWRGDQ